MRHFFSLYIVSFLLVNFIHLENNFIWGRNLDRENKIQAIFTIFDEPENVEFSNTGEIGHFEIGMRSTDGNNSSFLWPKQGKYVYIPYVSDLDPFTKQIFAKQVRLFAQNSCIRWVPRSNEDIYVTFTSTPPPGWDPTRCLSKSIGRSPDNQLNRVYLSPWCTLGVRAFNVAHEMLHVLNFIHEHQRRDRDCFIRLSKRFVQSDILNQGIFSEVTHRATDESFPYDYHSVMHYETMRTWSGSKTGPWSANPSEMDLIKLNYMYCGGPHYCQLYPNRCRDYYSRLAQCR